MDGKTFTKVLKDSKIIAKKTKVTSTDADLTFAKIKVRGKRLIGYPEFKKGLQEVAKRAKVDGKTFINKVIACGGPTARGTKADNVRLARKDQFCGVATRGGPSTIDLNPHQTGLQGLLDRSDYDIRGRKVVVGAQKHRTSRKYDGEKLIDAPLAEDTANAGGRRRSSLGRRKSGRKSVTRVRRPSQESIEAAQGVVGDTTIFVTGKLRKNIGELRRAMYRLYQLEEDEFDAQLRAYAEEL